MFFSLVLGVLAGLAVPFVLGPLTDFAKSKFELNEREGGIAAFGLVLLAAALIGAIVSSGSSAFWLILGGLLGVFGMRLVSMAQARTNDVMAARQSLKDDAAKDVADAAEDAKDAVTDIVDDVKETVDKKV